MAITLTHFEIVEDQEFEIAVKYDIKNFEVEDIEAVYITAEPKEFEFTEGASYRKTISVWAMFQQIPEMDVAINKIVERVDWRELYAETVNQ